MTMFSSSTADWARSITSSAPKKSFSFQALTRSQSIQKTTLKFKSLTSRPSASKRGRRNWPRQRPAKRGKVAKRKRRQKPKPQDKQQQLKKKTPPRRLLRRKLTS